MTTHVFEITITRKEGLSDPEGTTAKKALHDLGYGGVGDVSFGRIIAIEVEAKNLATARSQVEEMCMRLLANPVIEAFAIEAVT
ncbi:MAG: phosphoribosylformylglycinamidine synthase subunit PurS [Acidimicrobiia bacterium]|nr:phosphoribosylformylglycinamidine synthase subunit PurS [Acidimicrobiia bacterium]